MATEYKLPYTGSEISQRLAKIDSLAEKSEIPTVPTNVSAFNNDKGYLTAIPSEYITETELTAKGYLTEHQSLADYAKTADLGGLATKDIITKTDLSSDIQTSLGKADTALQSYTETDPTVPSWAKASTKPTYTAIEVGADASGTADGKVSAHNTSETSHNDIRGLVTGLTTRLNTLADSDDTTLDQLSEIVAYIKANKSLIDSITTNKVNVADIIDNLTTSVANKPLSAKMGVELKALIDAIEIPTSLPASDVSSWAKAATKPTYTKSEVGLGNVDNVKQYSASNPPPYPVTSVNGKTGAVSLSASDVGADASGTASSVVSTHNTSNNAHADIREQISQISSGKVDKDRISLGIASDGLIYIFVNGSPVGTGIPQSTGVEGDVFGYVDENNTIVLNGKLADGTYTIKYEMEDGDVIDIGNMVLDSTVYYSVTSNVTNCTNSNDAKTIAEGGSYSSMIFVDDGYELSSVVVTMGGTDISASAVSGGCEITIANVTGNIVITAVAEEMAAEPTNFLEYNATNKNDWSIWINNARIGSDGAYRSSTGQNVTNYIPVQNGDVVHWHDMPLNGQMACLYKSDKTKIAAADIPNLVTQGHIKDVTTLNATTYDGQLTINNANAAYIRFTILREGYTSIFDNDDGAVNIERNGEYLTDGEVNPIVYYTITNNLNNCTNSNSINSIAEGGSYVATITANSGYELKSLTVTMGGQSVSVSGGSINIASVTGDIVITAVAEEVQAAEPVTVDIALTDNLRIGSDGTDRTQAGYCATPHIDLTAIPKPCTIHLTKAFWCDAGQTYTMVRVYAKKADGAQLVTDIINPSAGGSYFTVVDNSGGTGNDVTVTVTSADVGYIRFSGWWAKVGCSDNQNSFASAGTKATLTYTPN